MDVSRINNKLSDDNKLNTSYQSNNKYANNCQYSLFRKCHLNSNSNNSSVRTLPKSFDINSNISVFSDSKDGSNNSLNRFQGFRKIDLLKPYNSRGNINTNSPEIYCINNKPVEEIKNLSDTKECDIDNENYFAVECILPGMSFCERPPSPFEQIGKSENNSPKKTFQAFDVQFFDDNSFVASPMESIDDTNIILVVNPVKALPSVLTKRTDTTKMNKCVKINDNIIEINNNLDVEEKSNETQKSNKLNIQLTIAPNHNHSDELFKYLDKQKATPNHSNFNIFNNVPNVPSNLTSDSKRQGFLNVINCIKNC